MKGISTSYELAERYRQQINAEFRPTQRQTNETTREGRHKQLKHLRKLSQKVRGRSLLALTEQGVI